MIIAQEEKNESHLFIWLMAAVLTEASVSKEVFILCNKHVTTKYNNRAVFLN